MKFFSLIRKLITLSAYIAGVAILIMMVITTMDVILRTFGDGITGAYDLVRVLGVIAVAGGLPYVTAVKGHIAIEFFYHKCGRTGRFILDTFFRIFAITIFGLLAVHTVKYGNALHKTGEVFPTLGIPVFWIPYVISFNSVLMIAVFVYHLVHPGKEYIRL